MAGKPIITHERLKEVLSYSPVTGEFIWLCATARKITPGDKAGTLSKSTGYFYITIDNVRHAAHRWAWFYMSGEMPKDQIDHINCDRTDNRFDNLREATLTENNRNRSRRKTNTSGHKGVYWHIAAGKWAASICVDCRTLHLGLFTDIEEAARVRRAAENEHFGKFARHQ